MLSNQTDPDVHPNLRRIAYGGGNGAHDAVIDAIAEELTRVLNEALAAITPAQLEQLLDLLITARIAATPKQTNGGCDGSDNT